MLFIDPSWIVIDFPSERKRGEVLHAGSRTDQGHRFPGAVSSKNPRFGPIQQDLVPSDRPAHVDPRQMLPRGGQGLGHLRGHRHRLEASLGSHWVEVLGGQAPIWKTAFGDDEVSAIARRSGRAWATSLWLSLQRVVLGAIGGAPGAEDEHLSARQTTSILPSQAGLR